MKKMLAWKYCECGCYGSELRIGSLYFWSYRHLRLRSPTGQYVDLDERNYDIKSVSLHEGHGFYTKRIGQFSTAAECDAVVLGIIRANMSEMKKVL